MSLDVYVADKIKLAINLRNRIIHGYDSVDDEIVYATFTQDLDDLKAALSRLLGLEDRKLI